MWMCNHLWWALINKSSPSKTHPHSEHCKIRWVQFTGMSERPWESQHVFHPEATFLFFSSTSLCQPLPQPTSLSFLPTQTRTYFRQRKNWWYLLLQSCCTKQIQNVVSHTGLSTVLQQRRIHPEPQNTQKPHEMLPIYSATPEGSCGYTGYHQPPSPRCATTCGARRAGGQAWTPTCPPALPFPSLASTADPLPPRHCRATRRSQKRRCWGTCGTRGRLKPREP